MNERRLHRSGAWIAVVLAVSLAGTVAVPSFAAVQKSSDQPVAAETRPLYRIGIGDMLDVYIFEDNSHNECLVRPDGRITIPLGGEIDAEGTTAPDLTAKIKKALEPFQKDPTVTVTVRQINSYRVYVLGNVHTQGVVASNSPLRLLQAVAMAGGLNEFANKGVRVIRERKSAPGLIIPINYAKIVKGEALDMNIWLESGDVVVAE
jgi:polysaccharide biosynthesis/export protein